MFYDTRNSLLYNLYNYRQIGLENDYFKKMLLGTIPLVSFFMIEAISKKFKQILRNGYVKVVRQYSHLPQLNADDKK